VSSPFYSPRGPASHAGSDLGKRSVLVARQRVRTPRQRERRGSALRAVLRTVAVVLLLAGGAGVAAHWLLTSPRFAVTRVEVEGASRVSRQRVLAVAGVRPGTNLLRVDPLAVVARLEGIPEVRRAEVVRALPNHVTIRVEERRPFTLLSTGTLHWLDEDGYLVGDATRAVAPPVPVISGLSTAELATLRTHPSARTRAAIALIRVLLRSGSALTQEISEIDMSRPEGPVLYTLDGVEVRLGSEQWEERLARLEGVLTQVAEDPESVRTIDLRFRDQVVLTRGGQS